MRRLILAIALVTAACGSPAADSPESTMSTTSTTASTTTTSTTMSTSTTTTTRAPQPFIGDNTRFRPGTTYRGTLPAVDVDFGVGFQLDGWRVAVRGIGVGRYIVFDNLESEPGTDVLLMAFRPTDDVDSLIDWFLNHENVDDNTAPRETSVGGLPAVSVDIRVAPEPPPSDEPCTGRMLVAADESSIGPGVLALEVWACTWARVWVVDVEGTSITIVGMASFQSLDPNRDPWQIEGFQPFLDDFVNGITFCTEAAPCDG